MRAKTTISDFRFEFAGYGHYKVTYTSPVTGKQWTAKTNDMPLIDATKNADEPKRRDLETLKRVCKISLLIVPGQRLTPTGMRLTRCTMIHQRMRLTTK